jgi:hypothetical protein
MSEVKLRLVVPDLPIGDKVAIIGSSSILLDKEYGSLIDSYDTVIRFNRAPTIGFEKYVGSKTTIRVTNPHVFQNIPVNDNRWKDPNKTQPAKFIKNQENINVIHIGGPQDNGWEIRGQHIHPTSKAFKMNYNGVMVHNLSKQPTVGILTIKLMTMNDIVPDLFGFGINENGASHYWEDKDPISQCHNYNDERDRLKTWEKEGKVKLFL